MIDLKKLTSRFWRNNARVLSEALSDEIFGSRGGEVVTLIRQEFEQKRQSNIEKHRRKFVKNATLKNMDEEVNSLTSGLLRANEEAQDVLAFDFLNYVHKNAKRLGNVCPKCIEVSKLVFSGNISAIQSYKLITIVHDLIFRSIAQSGKSNAGNAGEFFVSAIFESLEFEEGKHYSRQYKSAKGSDTDFVLPSVKEGRDQDIEMCCAVQFTSNDRLRMVNSELKNGSLFVITGNGLDAASKNCDDLGVLILNKARLENHKLVCYDKERSRVIEKLEETAGRKKKDGSPYKASFDARKKLEFYKDYCISFSDFAIELKKRFEDRSY